MERQASCGNIMPESKWNYLNHKRTISKQFYSKLAGSLVTLFVKYFHYFKQLPCNIMRDGVHAKATKRAIIGFILNRESII